MNTIKVNNIAELKNRKGTLESTVEVLGYYIEGDGGGGTFYWDNISTEVDNGGTIISVISITTGRWKRIYDKEINVRWFGAKGDGTTDDTISIQNSINASVINGIVNLSIGKYSVSTLLISKPIRFLGKSEKHSYYFNSKSTVSNVLGGSVLIHNSTILPLIKLKATGSVVAGIEIANITMLQPSALLASPTAYDYLIKDEVSTSYISGLQLHDLMLIGWKGISLTATERFDIYNINIDCQDNEIYVVDCKDVSTIKRWHSWVFARTENNYKVTNLEYAFKIDRTDEIYMSEIFIWKRPLCFSIKDCWGSLINSTADNVGKLIRYDSHTKSMPFLVDNIKCIANHTSGINMNSLIELVGTFTGDKLDVNFSNLYFSNNNLTENYQTSIVEINSTTCIANFNNININYFTTYGFNIIEGKKILLNDINFNNYAPNQTLFDVSVIGILNNSVNCLLSIKNLIPSSIKNVYDGYFENTTFDKTSNLINSYTNIAYSVAGRVTYTSDKLNGVDVTDNDSTQGFLGSRVYHYNSSKSINNLTEQYFYGSVVYKVIGSNLVYNQSDSRILTIAKVGNLDLYLEINKVASSNKRISITKFEFTPSSNIVSNTVPGRRFTGQIKYYSFYLTNSLYLTIGFEKENYISNSIPVEGLFYQGDTIYNDSPSSTGFIGWVCTTSGTPGTWTEFGTIEKLKKGTSIQSGNGVLTSFTIPHTLGTTPTFINIQAGSFDAQDIGYITANSTNITINYNVAPLTGTNNLTFYWEASI